MSIRAALLIAFLFSIRWAYALPEAPKHQKSIYDYSLVTFDGRADSLATYKGKVLVIVNLASKSIYKDQMPALEDLQKTYADKGLVVIGIPSTDFGGQELSDNKEIEHHYKEAEQANFPVYAKASLRGKDTIPLVKFLTDPKEGAGGGEIHWNFTKFVVDRQGQPVMRLDAGSDPADPEFRVNLEKVLAGTYKKKEPPAKEPDAPDEDDDGGL